MKSSILISFLPILAQAQADPPAPGSPNPGTETLLGLGISWVWLVVIALFFLGLLFLPTLVKGRPKNPTPQP